MKVKLKKNEDFVAKSFHVEISSRFTFIQFMKTIEISNVNIVTNHSNNVVP